MNGEFANEISNDNTKTKAYVPIWVKNGTYQKREVLVKFEQVSEAVVHRCFSK